MLTGLFYYTLCIMLVYVLAAATNLSAYLVSHRRTFLCFCIAFIFYFFDVSLVFKDDFITPGTVLGAQSFWDVGNPQATILTGVGMFIFLWMGICTYANKRSRLLVVMPIVAYAVLSFISFNVIQQVQWREFAFYGMRSLLVYFMLVTVAIWHATSGYETKALLDRHRIAYVVVLVFNTAVVAGNVYFQLLFDPSTVPSDMWFFAERSPSENMMFLTLALMTMRPAWNTLGLHYDMPPTRTDPVMTGSIEQLLPLYAKKSGLSKREQDVLRLVVMGKDNQNIASGLNLALSTVKVHMHNILKKTGQPDRKALVKDFWEH